jgi:hypothetical protein
LVGLPHVAAQVRHRVIEAIGDPDLHALDWTGRFDVGTSPGPGPEEPVEVGVLLPATFFWLYPVAAMRRRGVRKDRAGSVGV